jgi:hypothetical protein
MSDRCRLSIHTVAMAPKYLEFYSLLTDIMEEEGFIE